MYDIYKVTLRTVLNSSGQYSAEAEVVLATGEIGVASAPRAIRCGHREKETTDHIRKTIHFYNRQARVLIREISDQGQWDELLMQYLPQWGSDITLSLSLAFARAAARKNQLDLKDYIQQLAGIKETIFSKTYLVPVFSGGIHDRNEPQSIQQIMFAITGEDFGLVVDRILELYGNMEKRLIASGNLEGYSASSGFMASKITLEQQLAMLTDEIDKTSYAHTLSIALDVAAEHLKVGQKYRFYGEWLDPCQLENRLVSLADLYPISFIEDPFDYHDRDRWISLKRRISKRCSIFSDDATATQVHYVDAEIASGSIIKMKQVGSLSATLEMAAALRKHCMQQCISHRSHETEDCFMCDLSMALNAEYTKIGGPRRGDRIAKYNQFLRLYEKHQQKGDNL